jgi:hypothetical protein
MNIVIKFTTTTTLTPLSHHTYTNNILKFQPKTCPKMTRKLELVHALSTILSISDDEVVRMMEEV